MLETAIDAKFDLFEIWVLRNTFAVAVDLIPYIALEHQVRRASPFPPRLLTRGLVKSTRLTRFSQEHFDEKLQGQDEEAMREYEQELQLYEEELKKERELVCAAEFVTRKVESVQQRAQEVGHMRGAGAFVVLCSVDLRDLVASRLADLFARLATMLYRTTQRESPRTRVPTHTATRTRSDLVANAVGTDTGGSGRRSGPLAIARCLRQLGGDVQGRCVTSFATRRVGSFTRGRRDHTAPPGDGEGGSAGSCDSMCRILL